MRGAARPASVTHSSSSLYKFVELHLLVASHTTESGAISDRARRAASWARAQQRRKIGRGGVAQPTDSREFGTAEATLESAVRQRAVAQ